MDTDLNGFEDLFPRARPGIKAAIIDRLIPQAELTRPRRLLWCLAQCAHETAGFTRLAEVGGAAYLARYDQSRALGNTEPGDGARFKGRGLLMLTGRWNYTAFAQHCGEPLTSDFIVSLAQPEQAAAAAAWFWTLRQGNTYCDLADFVRLTQVINGGLNGLKSRRTWRYRLEDTGRCVDPGRSGRSGP